MKAHEFVSAVQESARIHDHDHAEQAVRATFVVLGQRLSTEAKDLAAQLPPELADAMSTDGSVERFGLDEFYRRVAEQEGQGCAPEQARQHARAVTAAAGGGGSGVPAGARPAAGRLRRPDAHRERPALRTQH